MNNVAPHQQITSTRSPSRKRKRFVLVFASMMVGLLPLATTEVVLRCCGIGQVSDSDDPYVGFSGVRPLFKPNQETGRYETAPERLTFFRPDSFSIEKGHDEFRIFCLGGSTVQGRPYAIETSFTTWLELGLRASDPQRQWEVVNCGGVSYASYRLVPILREVLEYQPDLVIICTGHNEFLEDRTYGPIKQTPHWITWVHTQLARLHTYNALRGAAVRLRRASQEEVFKKRPQLPEEVNALLDYRDGLADYHRDARWHQGTIAHFEYNLHRMVALAHDHHVPVILVNPPYNLKDAPPFKYLHRSGITDDERVRFDTLWEDAKLVDHTLVERIELLKQAVAIDDQHAGVRFHLGRCYLRQEQFEAAKAELVAAKDEDICPLRILSPMREIVATVARDHRAELVDAQQLFERLTPDGITGERWFLDHVHPTMFGHQELASALFDEMQRLGWVHPTSGWKSRRDADWRQHLNSLDAMFYIRGQQRLEGLRLWTQGRASLAKPAPQVPLETPSAAGPNIPHADDAATPAK